MGRAIALRLAAAGFDIAVAHRGDAELAEATVADVAATGRQAAAFAADVADEDAVTALFEAIEQRFGALDVVVHTAGINRAAPLMELDLADFDAIFRANVRGTFVVNKHAARRVRSGGAIINVASTVVRLSPPGLSAYTASKASVQALTTILAKELRDRDITVNAVAPGPTATQAFLDSTPDEERQQLAGMSPLGRLGEPRDIAGVVAFLAGEEGRWINGQTVHANGGLT